jgi:hypothetical protein
VGKGFRLWVDALCINQRDLEERGRQLGKMRGVYGSAWCVVAWYVRIRGPRCSRHPPSRMEVADIVGKAGPGAVPERDGGALVAGLG